MAQIYVTKTVKTVLWSRRPTLKVLREALTRLYKHADPQGVVTVTNDSGRAETTVEVTWSVWA